MGSSIIHSALLRLLATAYGIADVFGFEQIAANGGSAMEGLRKAQGFALG